MSSLINKAKDKIEQTLSKDSNKGDNSHSTNAGPHSSNLANKGDPRIDSDRDHRNDPTSHAGGYGHAQTGDQYGTAGGYGNTRTGDQYGTAGGYGNPQTGGQYGAVGGPGGVASSNTHGSRTTDPGYNNPQSTNAGPHSSNLLNKLDPRTDSDRDHRNDPTSRVGGHGNTQQYAGAPGHEAQLGHPGHTGNTGHTAGLGNTTTAGIGGYTDRGDTYDQHSSNTGPHSSNLANKLDPRTSNTGNYNEHPSHVGGHGAHTETYGQHTGGHGAHPDTYGQHTGGQTGYAGAGTTGGYDSRAPTGTAGGYGDSSNTPGSGNARNTAGPHNSDLLNKLDPRVDADLDGSKTYGGNKTHY